MKKHHIDLIENAKILLESIDSDDLLEEFLELQEKACGPSVHDFFQNMTKTTSNLYCFQNNLIQISSDKEMFKMDISDWGIPCILSLSKDFDIKSANDDKYHLNPKEVKKFDSFVNKDDCFFALAS